MSKNSDAFETFSFGLIALIRRLGGDVTLTKVEVDETSEYIVEPIYDPHHPSDIRLKVHRKADVQRKRT